MNNTASKELFRRIIGCGLINCQQCHEIYNSQGCADIRDFQVPEPWSGDIENAPILFVGINPGFTPGELYPKLNSPNPNNPSWIDPQSFGLFDLDKVEDFFENRFNHKHTHLNPYVKIQNKKGKLSFSVRMNDGSYKNVRGYWNYIQSISDIISDLLLNNNSQKTMPGKDYALTELVHCKSLSIDYITTDCYKKCANSFFNDILNVATNLRYLIVIGAKPRKYVSKLLNHGTPKEYDWRITKNVKVLYAPHNASGGSLEEIQRIIEELKQAAE